MKNIILTAFLLIASTIVKAEILPTVSFCFENGTATDDNATYSCALKNSGVISSTTNGNHVFYTSTGNGYLDLTTNMGNDVFGQLGNNFTISIDLCQMPNNKLEQKSWVWSFCCGTSKYIGLVNNPGNNNWACVSNDGNKERSINTKIGISEGVWHNMTVVRKDSIGYIYYDGRFVAKDSLCVTPSQLASSLTQCGLGKSGMGGTSFSRMMFDNFKIYDSALTDSEIVAISNNRPTVTAISNVTSAKVLSLSALGGSQTYAVYFPYDVASIKAKGNADRVTYNGTALALNEDFVLRRYEHPYFKYLEDNDIITSGCYLVQFADNYAGMDITLNFGSTKTGDTHPNDAYRFIGAEEYTKVYTPEGKFYRFNSEKEEFRLTENESILPFEGYIYTTEANPKSTISTGTTTSIFKLKNENGQNLTVIAQAGGVNLKTNTATTVDIYAISGCKATSVEVNGSLFVALAKGIYVIGGKKIAIVK